LIRFKMIYRLSKPLFFLLSFLLFLNTARAEQPADPYADEGLFPFVISKAPQNNLTNFATWDPEHPVRPAGSDGFVRVEDGHFVTDAGRILFFGTNLSCDAPFPKTHEDAEFLAQSLARFGFNVVRLHYLDNPGRFFPKKPKTLTQFDPEQLERFDYLVSQLEKNGIYVNINLHVSRKLDDRDGFPDFDSRPTHDRGVTNFYPANRKADQDFARAYLTHVNPYTGRSYANDPGVAMIELNNENCVVASWFARELETLQGPYRAELQRQWNAFLLQKYGSTEKMRAAWRCRVVPESNELVRSGLSRDCEALASGEGLVKTGKISAPWDFVPGSNADCVAEFTPEHTVRAEIRRGGEENWAPQMHVNGITLEAGTPYTLKLRMRSTRKDAQPAKIYVSMGISVPPYTGAGYSTEAELTGEWKDFEFHFIPTVTTDKGRVGFTGFADGQTLEIASVSLRQGGIVGVPPEQTLENGTVQVLAYDDRLASREIFNDWLDFMVSVHKDYCREMYDFLKNDLGVKVPVAGTQLCYGSWHAEAQSDYCDIHSYWNHPNWRAKPTWYGRATAMVNHLWERRPGTNHLPLNRVYGKPFTVSEYNHPYPNPYLCEGLPMIFAMGAFQDWDAVYQYTWQHNQDYNQQKIEVVFDAACSQVQQAHLLACRAMFGRRDVTAGPKRFIFEKEFTEEDERNHFHEADWRYNSISGLPDSFPMAVNTGLNLGNAKIPANVQRVTDWKDLPEEIGSPEKRWVRNETGELYFDEQIPGKGFFTVNTEKTKIFSGFAAGRTFRIGDVSLKPGETRLDFLTFSMTRTDARHTLIAATGIMKNSGVNFRFLDEERVTYDLQNSGNAPVLCEGINAELTLPSRPGLRCWSLDPSGNRREEIPVITKGETSRILLSSEYKTLWYEIEN